MSSCPSGSREHPPSGEGWKGLSCPKREAAASPSLLSTGHCAAATSAPRQTMLQVSGMKWAIPCPICKTATREQGGTGSMGKIHSTIYLWSTQHPERGCTSARKYSWTDMKPMKAQTGHIVLFEDPAKEQISTTVMKPH